MSAAEAAVFALRQEGRGERGGRKRKGEEVGRQERGGGGGEFKLDVLNNYILQNIDTLQK